MFQVGSSRCLKKHIKSLFVVAEHLYEFRIGKIKVFKMISEEFKF